MTMAVRMMASVGTTVLKRNLSTRQGCSSVMTSGLYCLQSSFMQQQHRRTISASALEIHPTSTPGSLPPPETLQFGHTFTDHMLTIEYSNDAWQTPKIVPFANLSMSPASSGLHYGLQCFEGMKAYRCQSDDSVRLFRPDKNMTRLSSSMERLHLPGYDFDRDELLQCLKQLVWLDRDWIPQIDNYSLYLRPTVIATHPYLGLERPQSLLLYIICCPVGPYYKHGFTAVHLTADTDYVRAWPGGTGSHKVGGNYGATMKAQLDQHGRKFDQILWLRDNLVTEVGSMNVFFVMNHGATLVTPPLDGGDILPGVTRASILELARSEPSWNIKEIQERYPNMDEIAQNIQNGSLTEAFGAGTAALVTPIASIFYQNKPLNLPHTTGPVTQKVFDTLTGIQYGKLPGPDGWSVIVDGT